MKTAPVLVLLLLLAQLPTTDAFLWCFLFGWLGNLFAGTMQEVVNNEVAGETSETGLAAPYPNFRIDYFEKPIFEGCTVTFAADFTFVGNIDNENTNESGSAKIVGTFDIDKFLFGGFQICIIGLEVTELDFESPPGDGAEDWARKYINDQFEDPECF